MNGLQTGRDQDVEMNVDRRAEGPGTTSYVDERSSEMKVVRKEGPAGFIKFVRQVPTPSLFHSRRTLSLYHVSTGAWVLITHLPMYSLPRELYLT